jgi:hypothetical protein
MNVIQRDPSTLRIHHALAHHARWADGDPRLHALARSVAEHGVREPLQITPMGEIVDGRHRWLAAKRAQLETVPCCEVGEDSLATVVLDSLLNRRHLRPSQRAYLAVEFLEEALQEATQRRVKNLLQFKQSSPVRAKSLEEYAVELGLSPRLMDDAIRLWKAFKAHPERRTITDKHGVTEEGVTFHAFFEPRIMAEDDPYGLGAVLAGIGFILEMEKKGKHAGGKPKGVDRQLHLFNQIGEEEVNRWEYWKGFSEDDRRAHFSVRAAQFQRMAKGDLHFVEEYHITCARLAKKAASQIQQLED